MFFHTCQTWPNRRKNSTVKKANATSEVSQVKKSCGIKESFAMLKKPIEDTLFPVDSDSEKISIYLCSG